MPRLVVLVWLVWLVWLVVLVWLDCSACLSGQHRRDHVASMPDRLFQWRLLAQQVLKVNVKEPLGQLVDHHVAVNAVAQPYKHGQRRLGGHGPNECLVACQAGCPVGLVQMVHTDCLADHDDDA